MSAQSTLVSVSRCVLVCNMLFLGLRLVRFLCPLQAAMLRATNNGKAVFKLFTASSTIRPSLLPRLTSTLILLEQNVGQQVAEKI